MFRRLVACGLSLLVYTAGDAQTVRDHRERPGGAAQWKIGGTVDSVTMHALYNVSRNRQLVSSGSSVTWADNRPPIMQAIFENCTRPGELIYGSDRVAIRFGSRFFTRGGASLAAAGVRRCDFRLIPSQAAFVPAGEGDGQFAIYHIPTNQYLVYKSSALGWQPTTTGGAPGGEVARADLVVTDLFFTTGAINNVPVQGVYLTIQNIGNVPTSGSQQAMEISVGGEQLSFAIVKPIAPGQALQSPVRLNRRLSECEQVAVQLDIADGVKFQIGPGAFPNESVFANDRKTLYAHKLGGPEPSIGGQRGAVPCGASRARG
jgi:hypothetical protein